MNVYVVGGDLNYYKWIDSAVLVKNLADAQVVIFTGGSDVDPSLYGCEKKSVTSSEIERDLAEKEIFDKITDKQLCVGICRGSQFLCVMNGGLLIQDVTGHAISGTHSIVNATKEYEITSTHHQMQYPFNLSSEIYDVLYYTPYSISTHYYGDKILSTPPCEPEVVYYHKSGLPKCLAIQGHPEYMRSNSPVVIMLNELIKNYV